MAEFGATHKIELLLQDQRPVDAKFRLQDGSSDKYYDMIIRCRRMGEDNGKDQLVHVANYLQKVRDYLRQRVRKLSAEETARLVQVVANR
jgi:hypothetical protein